MLSHWKVYLHQGLVWAKMRMRFLYFYIFIWEARTIRTVKELKKGWWMEQMTKSVIFSIYIYLRIIPFPMGMVQKLLYFWKKYCGNELSLPSYTFSENEAVEIAISRPVFVNLYIRNYILRHIESQHITSYWLTPIAISTYING